MRRRDFLKVAASLAVAGRSVAVAQQAEPNQRIGVLSNLAAEDPEGRARNAAFVQAMQELGWTEERNLQIDYRWSNGSAEQLRVHAKELAAKAPDVLFATSGVSIGLLQQATTSIPIVFAQTIDPVRQGVVENLSRPGGNATGFTQHEFGTCPLLGGKADIATGPTARKGDERSVKFNSTLRLSPRLPPAEAKRAPDAEEARADAPISPRRR